MDPRIIATIGLLSDIVGAIWVVKGLVALRDEEIAAASDRTAVWGGGSQIHSPRPALVKLFADGRRDARIGALFLAVGFAGQLIATWMH